MASSMPQMSEAELQQNVKAALVAEGYKDKDWIVNFGRSVEDIATKHERARIVGLFDAAWAIGGTTGDHLNVARDIIEGLREKK
jgi:hypothetical protein